MFEAFTNQPIRLIGEDGSRTQPFELDLSADELLQIHRDMIRARVFDERLIPILRQGKTSFYAQSTGMEATQIGIAWGVKRDHDWFWPYYRDQGLVLTLGMPLDRWISQLLGSNSDVCKGRQMPQHFSDPEHHIATVCSAIGSHIAPAAGTAIAQKYLGTDEITVCTFGEGATSEGDWHAGVNMASANKAPCLFICENNQYAISLNVKDQTNSKNIAMKGHAYGIPGFYVDGQDVLAVRAVVKQAAEWVRAGNGSALIECLTYRIGTHSSSDDDSRYRSKDEVESWRRQDPLVRFERFLEKEGILPAREEIEAYYGSVLAEFEEALKKAENSGYPTWEILFDDVYSDLPDHLQQQAIYVREENL